ncbi:hypothetical protein P3T27_006283 [Kitasatospora sp. MAA19]|uniref:hypothetical protein n=1 Tax=Kitasatospora sp. MAA19 TaxID=3035090 RepID=UPI0024738C7C|nr:hypothetical protein [Kitasatospora sp. MAA19]MDH6709535.1 hypothetical protein [Kitasatospora sp. MAA19]
MWSKWVFITSSAVTSTMRAPVGDKVAASGYTAFGEVVLTERLASPARQAIR